MTIQSKTYDKSSGRTHSDVVAGYDVPFSALDLSLSFDTMVKYTKKTYKPIVNIEGEIWEPILGFEGLYEVSNKGRVKSLHYYGGDYPVLMKLQHNKNKKYVYILLSKNGKHQRKLVHRLVYESFVGVLPEFKFLGKGNGDKMYEINHKDEDTTNNRVENLELITRTQNINYGMHKEKVKQSQINNPLKSHLVYQYDLEFNLIKIWPSVAECGRNGFCDGRIYFYCKNNTNNTSPKPYKGYIWSYEPLKIESK